MKAFLLYKERDFDLQRPLPAHEPALTQDLELNTLFNAMALGDEFLFDVAKKVVFAGLGSDLDTILYRQDVLRDCLQHGDIVREIYNVAVEAIVNEKKHYWGLLSNYPAAVLSRSIEVLQMFVGALKKLRGIAAQHAGLFESDGFTTLFAMLKQELDDSYFARVEAHLQDLKFRDGVLVSAQLGKGNKGAQYVLRKAENNQSWFERIFSQGPPVYTVYIADRDINGARAQSELRDRGINLVANALAQSTDHILSFFKMLRLELGFYVGCLNLQEQLAQLDEPICLPAPVPAGERRHDFAGLYDVCLALTLKRKVVGNRVNADAKELMMITGANQGGKSTLLRSIGLAQLMMQAGLFVAAESFCANLCTGLFTHYKREEDATMTSGKLDEELSRMSDIVDQLRANSLVLFNESFAATNEREGSEIARQIVNALLEKRIKVFFVTHFYELAHGFYSKQMDNALFLRAERQADGRRTFQLSEGEPLQTSFGEDLYQRIFGAGAYVDNG